MKHYSNAILVLLIYILTSGSCFAEEIIDLKIKRHGDKYILHIEANIDADIKNVMQILTDYENLPAINPYLKESKLVSKKTIDTDVNMLTEACIFIICYKFRHYQRFEKIAPDTIYAKIIPEQSDFRYGWTKWKLKNLPAIPSHKKTQVLVDSEFVPDFFVMPIIGQYQLKRKIAEISSVTIKNLEKILAYNYKK